MNGVETLELKTEDLLLFDRACSFVPQNPMVPSSQFIKLSRGETQVGLSLSSHSHLHFRLNPQLTASKKWSWFLDRGVVAAFASVHAKSKTIFVDKLPDKVILRSGRHKAAFSAMDAVTGYPGAAKDDHQKPVKLDAALLSAAAKFAAAADIAEHLSCVYLKQKEGVYASDSFALFHYTDVNIPISIPLPTLIAEACGSLDGKLLLGSDKANMTWPQGSLHQMVSDHCLRKFPLKTFQGLIKDSAKASLVATFKTEVLGRVLARLSPFARGGDLVLCEAKAKSLDLPVVLDIPSGRVVDKIKLDKPVTVDVKRWWALDRLVPWIDFVRKRKGETIELRFHQGHNIWFSKLGKHNTFLILSEISK